MEQKNGAAITRQEIKKKFTYDSVVMLTLEIDFPQIRLNRGRNAQNRINMYYMNAAHHFFNYAATELYSGAIKDYHYAQKNKFPFRTYDAVMHYTVTLNQDCTLSTYFDQYTYTGGAHGNTLRFSENWDLQTGSLLQLSDLFGPEEKCCRTLLEYIMTAADAEMKKDPGIFFEEYRALLTQYFDPNSFYLTPTGVSVYYQQYEIAPYASGIPVFEIPYAALKLKPPSCK